MTKIKDIFLGQLSDSLNIKLIGALQDSQRQKEIRKDNQSTSAAASAISDSLSTKPETGEQGLPSSIPETAEAKEVADQVVGE